MVIPNLFCAIGSGSVGQYADDRLCAGGAQPVRRRGGVCVLQHVHGPGQEAYPVSSSRHLRDFFSDLFSLFFVGKVWHYQEVLLVGSDVRPGSRLRGMSLSRRCSARPGRQGTDPWPLHSDGLRYDNERHLGASVGAAQVSLTDAYVLLFIIDTEFYFSFRRVCKLDKGAAMTVVFKKTSPGHRTGNEVVVATDRDTNRLLFHQRLSGQHKERQFELPLEIFLVNSEVVVRHDLIDPQIAICAPSALPLFADNFDFANRDDFVRGLLINEEILASTIYFSELPAEQYAARVNDWQSYQLVSNDIINRWVFPMVPDMGVCLNRQIYMFLRNNVYRSADVQLARSGELKEEVVIREGSSVDDGTRLAHAVVGINCRIGKNCDLRNVYLFDGVVVEDNCVLNHCVIGTGSRVEKGSRIEGGAVVGNDVRIPAGSNVLKHFVQSREPEFGKSMTESFELPKV